MREMKLQDLKAKTPAELVSFAEELEVENASTMRKQELMFALPKAALRPRKPILSAKAWSRSSPTASASSAPPIRITCSGPDDIYVSPSQIRRFGLRTGDTVEGQIRGPKEGERYFALLKVNALNFEDPGKGQAQGQFRQPHPALSR